MRRHNSLEQGGYILTPTSGNATVTLLKNYKNLDYNIQVCGVQGVNYTTATWYVLTGEARTVQSIIVLGSVTGYILGIHWKTEGYTE